MRVRVTPQGPNWRNRRESNPRAGSRRPSAFQAAPLGLSGTVPCLAVASLEERAGFEPANQVLSLASRVQAGRDQPLRQRSPSNVKVVPQEGFEPPTPGFSIRRSTN